MKTFAVVFGLVSASALTSATVLDVVVPPTRSGDTDAVIQEAATHYANRWAQLTARDRVFRAEHGQPSQFTTPPLSVRLSGTAPRTRGTPGRGPISLQFDTTGPGAFPDTYRLFLQDVFTRSVNTLNLLFGFPSESGTVRVLNFDATLSDRNAVIGGIYVHNNNGDREIRFPIYQDTGGIKPEVAAVNFIHTLLLAYLGGKPLPNDAWQEGLVRAVTMNVVRTPGSLPSGLGQFQIEDTLSSTYSVGPFYDWYNQRALGGPNFIAPNLLDTALPVGGSVGGLYLLRYQMAGSAFQKVLVQNPTFAKEFLDRFYLNPTITSRGELVTMAQTTLNSLDGPNALVEGSTFNSWSIRQHVLDSTLTPGRKLLVQPFSITDGLSGNDFGVFGIQAHAFETSLNGNESLSRETSFPIFWSPDFTRIFATAQDDRIDIVQGFGSVVPNFVDAFGGQPYRVTVDVPVRDQLARVFLPAGAATTGATTNDIYGTINGVDRNSAASYEVIVQLGSQSATLPVRNFAFGSRTNFTQAGRLRVTLRRIVNATPEVILRRDINKGPGPLAMELEVPTRFEQDVSLGGGVRGLGINVEPFLSDARELLGGGATLLVARWDPLQGRYRFYPESGGFSRGKGYFIRTNAGVTRTILGQTDDVTPVSVALEPGWNLITNPLNELVNVADISVIRETDAIATFGEAGGTIVGPDVFRFRSGANDAFTGVPEGGTLEAATSLSPGDAIYVRCLSSSGATLLFTPNVFRSVGRSTNSSIPPQTDGWNLKARLTGPDGTLTMHLGRRSGAATGDDRFDSQLAPAFGNYRLAAERSLYRDIRGLSGESRYMLNLTGLTVGRSYELRLDPTFGNPGFFWIKHNPTGFARKYLRTGLYRFVARTSSMQVEVVSR